MEAQGSCAVCKKASEHKCANCHIVAYCSKQHQKDDWKTHKLKCVPYKVVEDEVIGRHLVALRSIAPGELILREAPIVSGPLQTTNPVCLGCYKLLNQLTAVECSLCGWPMCSSNCAHATAHEPECRITTEYRKSKVQIKTFDLPHPNYQCLMVLRCLDLKRSNQNLWEKLNVLQSHSEERKATAKYQADRIAIAEFIHRFFKYTEFPEEEIMRVAGIVEVNDHEVPLADPGYVSIYQAASFLEHNCHANCSKSFTSTGDLVIRAATAVKRGQHLSICYTDSLWGTTNRRQYLKETKFFSCRCVRCSDPTELGTQFSSLLCQSRWVAAFLHTACNAGCLCRDCLGDVVCSSPLDGGEDTYWACQQCGKTMSSTEALSILKKTGQALSSLDKNSMASLKSFISTYSRVLDKNHYLLTDAKLALVNLCGQGDLASVNNDDLALMMSLSWELYELTTALVPAENRTRGVLLFELHSAIAEDGRRKAANGSYVSEDLRDNFLECKKVLQQAYNLLRYEPEVLPEGFMAIQAEKNIAELDKMLFSLQQNIDNTPLL